MRFLALIIGLLLISPIEAKQKYYKWTDADGNTHYSERKPHNSSQTSEVKVSTSRSKITYKTQDTDEDQNQNTNSEEKTDEQLAVEEFNKQEKERVTRKQNQENCKIAKQNYATLQKTIRVRQVNPATGETIRMDDKQRTQMLKATQESIKQLCG